LIEKYPLSYKPDRLRRQAVWWHGALGGWRFSRSRVGFGGGILVVLGVSLVVLRVTDLKKRDTKDHEAGTKNHQEKQILTRSLHFEKSPEGGRILTLLRIGSKLKNAKIRPLKPAADNHSCQRKVEMSFFLQIRIVLFLQG
jgi:hypothetical protein